MPSLDISGVKVLPRLPDYVTEYANTTPDATAVVFDNERICYAELEHQIRRWARALLASGVRKGDRVAMLSTPRPEFWIAFLATARIGGIWVGLNPRYTHRECAYVVGDAQPSVLVSIAAFDGIDYQEHVDAVSAAHPGLQAVAFAGTLEGCDTLAAFLAVGERIDDATLEAAENEVSTTDPCLIVYTSGSTGSPKGAVLTHYGLTYGATLQTTHFDIDDPGIVVSFPINHVASVADTCATTLVKGGKIVFQEQFDPISSVAATSDERCTLMGGVPTMYQMQLAATDFDSVDLSALRLILWGGAAMPVETIRQLQATGARLVTAYGMTETATHVTYTDADADFDTLATTVGRPDPHCEFRIETDNGQPSSENNTGEIQLRADFLMTEYWRRPDASAEARTPDGWFRTGDVGYIRPDGNVRLVGRMSDMFKSGGYNVYPREIESVLEQHAAVALAAVVGVPDPLYQEVGCAWIQREAGTDVEAKALEQWCRDKVANYKVPKSFRIVDELPLLPVGKVDKTALRKRSREA